MIGGEIITRSLVVGGQLPRPTQLLAAIRSYYAKHTDELRAANRARSESRRGYQRDYQRRRRAMMRAGKWKPRASDAP